MQCIYSRSKRPIQRVIELRLLDVSGQVVDETLTHVLAVWGSWQSHLANRWRLEKVKYHYIYFVHLHVGDRKAYGKKVSKLRKRRHKVFLCL